MAASHPQLQAAINAGEAKASMPAPRSWCLSALAGLFIGLGACCMLVVKADTSLGFGTAQLLGGVAFSLGLFLVLVAGAELFTGNSLMAIAALEGRFAWGTLARSWVRVYLGNALGALILCALLAGAGFAGLGSGAVGEAAVAVASSKAALPAGQVFFRAVLCNMLVCLSVWMAFSATSVGGKLCCAVLPVAAFVACGFEHCVANWFFLPFGMLVGGPAGPALGACAANIAMATLGNIVGGVAIGAVYWYCWRQR